MAVPRNLISVLAACSATHAGSTGTCPGDIHVAGYGPVSIVRAKWHLPGVPGGAVEVSDGRSIAPHLEGRSYWAKACVDGAYDRGDYLAPDLLGRTLRYTVNLSGVGCGCNAALHLVPMRQNAAISGCSDHYCDANRACGEACAELDVQEANQFAWHSTLHTATDHTGAGGGYGGGATWDGPRNWDRSQYGPGADCIDTRAPFQVAASFPATVRGALRAVHVHLAQGGCDLHVSLSGYAGMAELSEALRAGVTPVVSYWRSPDMAWMDGKGADGQGPCLADEPEACPDSVAFYDFAVAAIGEGEACEGARAWCQAGPVGALMRK